MAGIKSFRDLKVYQELKRLHLEVHRRSLTFPKFEMHELGSQVRRSSNSAPANIAEGWGSRHTNIYLEAVNRALGETRETQHHLEMAWEKGYLTEEQLRELDAGYDSCGRMLESLYEKLTHWRGSTRTSVLREEGVSYELNAWEEALATTEDPSETDRRSPKT